jgi:proline racemase
MESGGYVNMCGHGTIGVCTVAVEMGMVTPTEPITNITLDTPAGIVKAGVAVSNGRTKGVTFENVPAFLYKKDVLVNTPSFGEIKMDIAFGGNFFALISGEQLDLKIEKSNAQKLIDTGMEILECANNAIKVKHPEKPHINTIDLVEIFEKVPQEGMHYRNAVIFGEKSLDRSPCGTGTCAKMASLFARGELKIGQEFINESILGTQFIGRLKGTTKVAGLDAVIPEITGRAFVTGVSHYMIDDEDPLKYGFTLR